VNVTTVIARLKRKLASERRAIVSIPTVQLRKALLQHAPGDLDRVGLADPNDKTAFIVVSIAIAVGESINGLYVSVG
jgi:hypothetical protein